MQISVLASGSKGNVTFIHTDKLNLLIDLGPTCSYTEGKIKELGFDPASIKAIPITHTHSDHTKGLKVFVKKYKPTLFLTEKMYEDLSKEFLIENYVLIDGDFSIENVNVKVIKTSHDASDSNGYVIECDNHSVVYMTDTGFINQKYFDVLKNRSVYIMESNHDIEMLLKGRYPYQLRRRVLSDRGHLSNVDSANYLAKFIGEETKEIILAHLSEENNTKELALNTLYGILEENNITVSKIVTADQFEKNGVDNIMIKVICVGKIKEKFLKEAIAEYEKRLQKYIKLEIIELPDFSIDKEIDMEKEGINILKNIKDKDYVITLEIEGKALTSIELSKELEKIQMQNSDITFVIGGSNGLSEDVKKRSNYALSFSKLTFPHQLFRVMLLEQIYRAFKIRNNESYHK